MTSTTTTPNMNLPVPVASEAPGPAWASDVVTDMYAIDSHNHSSGQGVAITPAGMNINADLPFGGNNATVLRSTRFTAQASPLATGSDLGCVYVSGVDLYYNDTSGNQVRITTGGSVNAGAGSITGLPSGTASVSFAAATYTFQSATNTGATLSAGPVAIGSTTASGKQTTLASNAAQSANISLTLPTAAPTNGSLLGSDASGNLAWDTATGTNLIVRNASPTIATPIFVGESGGTIIGGSYSPTVTNFTGTTTAPGVWFYQRIGNYVTVFGYLSSTPSGAVVSCTVSLPIAPTNNFVNSYELAGTVSSFDNTLSTATRQSELVSASGGTKTAAVLLYTANNNRRDVGVAFSYRCA